ncbi:MFS transporter [Nocardia sp. CDC186]|uniref:MFS transporter n=1 Tax=Nocardia implantans TaxID=3108168 RepID=A0ABU6B4D4_9NOCA|nr:MULTISPECIES: MFS transporter [unclassified Nocardia]MEA3527743.1 MFS transporter [Nocardia sp. CDC192]MEB3514551.1 MFS transporter [Nocardia sp. CDC186]
METDLVPGAPVTTALRTPVVWFMAPAAALGTASIYPLQPAIAEVAGSLHTSVAAVGTALACGPLGYLVGLALLVPLVDQFAPRIVVATQFGALAVTSAASAMVGSPWLLGLVIGSAGAGSAVGAQLSSIAGRFAHPSRQATTLGIVTAGISAGILAGRIVGGWLTELIGWRGMLLAFAAACAVVAVIAYLLLPVVHGSAAFGYLATLRGFPGLYREFSALRSAAVRGALWFFAFCAIWAGLAVALSQPPYSYSAEQIGMYAVAGLLGMVATRVSGTWTDRVGARRVVAAGLVPALAATAALSVLLPYPVAALVCLGLFDAGLFAAQVANQSTVLAIDPAAPARFNSAYMIVYFVGGSLGTAIGAAAVGWIGWPATAALATAAIATAMASLRR